ncbi:MAG: SRPBCC domain-containing protein [Burkholderiaceae bacterium]
MNAPETFHLQLTRFIRAPREEVFDAFVTESQLRRWQSPRGMTVASCSSDAREGGRYRIEMRSRDGSSHIVGGTYRSVKRPERLTYTWQWEGDSPMAGMQTLIEIDFTAKDGGTELRMKHSGFPAAAARDGHDAGWNSVFNRLNDLLDPRGSAATLTLLGDARSTYTRSARMGFAEKGVAYTLQTCGPHTPEILAIHPFGRIPALRDGAIELWETSAILRYLDDSFDGPSLLPGMSIDRARCEQWVSAVNSYLYDTMVRRYVLQYVFPKGEGGKPDRGVIDAAVKEMAPQLSALERAYAKSGEFIAGSTLSIADLFLAPILAYVEGMPEGARLLSDMPNIGRAQGAMRQRASFTSTQPEHG